MPVVTERDDDAFEDLLGRVLRAGVLLAAAVVGTGGALYLTRHGHEVPAYAVFHGEPGDLRSIAGVIAEARRFSGRGVIQLGLLVLIATPVSRVVFALIGFTRQKDWMYVGVSLIVLGLLAYSLTGG